MRNKSWSVEEENIIKQHYGSEGVDVCKRLTNRSPAAVKRKAQEFGLYVRQEYMPWTEEEINIIKTYYPGEGKHCINRLPGRTVSNIQVMAHRLGIHKNKVY